jgi:Protein of unknown function (DUF2442)
MSTSAATPEATATDVSVSEYQLRVSLTDGREIAVPPVWFPRLLKAPPVQRANWRLIGRGEGTHWPDVDEDISVAGLLQPS